MTLLFAAAVLLAYPDSVRFVGTAYQGAGAIGGLVGCARVSVRSPDGRLHVVYSKNWGATSAESSDIFEVESDDDGLTWSPLRNVSRDGPYLSTKPALALDSMGVLHCCWFQFWDPTMPGRYDFFYSYRDGDTWSVPRNISRMSCNTNYAEYSSICADASGRIHVAFEIVDTNWPNIYYTAPSGDSWLTPVLVSRSPRDDGFPCIESDSQDRLHLCWRIYGSDSGYIMYSRRDTAWEPPRRIAACRRSVNSASLAVGPGDTVHVVYAGLTQSSHLDVFHIQSVGDSWTQPVNLSNSDYAESGTPRVAVAADGTVCAVWTEDPDLSMMQAVCRFRTHGGWGEVINLSEDTVYGGAATHVGLQMDDGHADILWEGGYGAPGPPFDTEAVYYIRASVPGSGIAEGHGGPRQAGAVWLSGTVVSDKVILDWLRPGDRVCIYDAAGRLVTAVGPASSSSLTWDCRDASGQRLGRGVYFVSFCADGRTSQAKVVLAE